MSEFPDDARNWLESRLNGAGFLSADDSQRLAEQLLVSSCDELMILLLPLAACLAAPVISDFYVGAVARGAIHSATGWGSLYLGANIEFGGEALTSVVHAEQAAVNHAWLRGERRLSGLAVTAAPCGYCRQFLHELGTGLELPILIATASGHGAGATQQDATQQDATQQDATQQDTTPQNATPQNATQQELRHGAGAVLAGGPPQLDERASAGGLPAAGATARAGSAAVSTSAREPAPASGPAPRRYVTTHLHELLPRAFGPEDLGRPGGLLDVTREATGIGLVHQTSDTLTLAALEAARASYAPYTGGYAGCALETSDGAVYTGRYAENAAYNPSFGPLQSAIAFVRSQRVPIATFSVVRAVLVEVPSKSGLRRASQAVLESFAPGVKLECIEAKRSPLGLLGLDDFDLAE